MRRAPAWRRYLTFWRANIVSDVNDELRFHEEMRVTEYVARGMSESDARRAVSERLGDVDAAKTECVELGHVRATNARNADFFDGLRADAAYAVRALARTPAWTAVTLLTIALGIGATTTVFRVADALLVRPLPYRDASRVFMARRQFIVNGDTMPAPLPAGISRVWRERAQTIESAALAGSSGRGLLGAGTDTVTVWSAHIDPEFFAFAGVHPIAGRVPAAAELAPASDVLLLTERFWRRHYGASPDVIGKTVTYVRRPHMVVGVAPASLLIPDFRSERADVIRLMPPNSPASGPVFVRLKPGVSRAAATAELEAIMKHAQLAEVPPPPMEMPLRLTRPQDWLAIRQPLAMLTAAVALLLVVACTNVAHLFLARGAARHRELAVRFALGARRSRLLRQLVTESVVVALVGGVLAIVVGWGGIHLLAALRPQSAVALTYVPSDGGIVSIASVLAIGCGLAIGLFAALRTAHRDIARSLYAGPSNAVRSGRRLRSALVVGEVAVSTTLLVGALLLIHAVFDLQRTHLGFDASGVYALTVPVPRGSIPAERAAVLRERASTIPGVRGLTIAADAPGGRGFTVIAALETPAHPRTPESATSGLRDYRVTPDYFAMMRIPFVAGRTFDEGSKVRNEVIVSRSVAAALAPLDSVIGLRIRNAVSRSRDANEWQTVIGIVPDVVTRLVEGGASQGFYRPYAPPDTATSTGYAITLIVRIDGVDAADRLKQFAAAVQPGGPRVDIINLRDQISLSLAEPRFTMRVLVAFAVLGVLLAAIGLFGVISYSVGQRTREIGVRMTLGATRGSIARLVVGDGVRLALFGTALGLLGAIAGTRIIQNSLYGVSRLDPFSFGAGAVLLLVVAAIACIVPMVRATGVDPVVAVRVE